MGLAPFGGNEMLRSILAAVLFLGMAGAAGAQSCAPFECSSIEYLPNAPVPPLLDDVFMVHPLNLPKRLLADCAYTAEGCLPSPQAFEIHYSFGGAQIISMGVGTEIRGPFTLTDPTTGKKLIDLKNGEVYRVGGSQ
jgi:hypothetical protein